MESLSEWISENKKTLNNMILILFFLLIVNCNASYGISVPPVVKAYDPDTLCLAGSSGYFSFSLASIMDNTPSDVVYEWTLQGYDKKWHTSEKRKRIHYMGLNPGSYLLTVRAFSSSHRKEFVQKKLLVLVHSESKEGRSLLFLYVVLLLLGIALIWLHASFFLKRISKGLIKEKVPLELEGKGYTDEDKEFIEKVERVLDEHYCDSHFNLSKLYQEIGMSRSSFNTKWKALGREVPRMYISRARFEKAKKLLHTTSDSITKVAEDCGFCDAKYFREVFKSEFGITPSEFRKSRMTCPEEEKQ